MERHSDRNSFLKCQANDETGIRLFSATEKDNTSSIPRIKMLIPGLLFQGKELTLPMGWVLHTCTYVGNLPIDIPLFSKLAPSVSPQSERRWNICKKVKSSGCSSGNKTRPDGLLLFKKEIPLLLDIAPIRENVAGVEVRDYGLLYDNP